MNIGELFATLQLGKKKAVISQLTTPWGENVDQEHFPDEYPRPQLVRGSYICLNGLWDAAFAPDPLEKARRSSTHVPGARKAAKKLGSLSETRKRIKPLSKAAAKASAAISKVADAADESSEKLLMRISSYTGEKAASIDLKDFRPYLKEPEYSQKILVPFPPESSLSGVGRVLKPTELLWYRRSFFLTEMQQSSRLLLNFGAVDEEALVFVNGQEAAHHHGGYLSFSADITPFVRAGENAIAVCVRDTTDVSWRPRGKQKLESGGMFYTPSSGIWQTVWLEWAPKTHIKNLKIVPHPEEGCVDVTVFTNSPCPVTVEAGAFRNFGEADVLPFPRAAKPDVLGRIPRPCSADIFKDADIGEKSGFAQGRSGKRIRLKLSDFKEWSPEDPQLSPLRITAGEDCALSYFAMRSASIVRDERGISRLALNGRPYYMDGALDQGYWPDGLVAAPSDEALIFDIKTMKDAGFNMLRKHIKIECARWYYHCDRLGMLVFQDIPNGGGRSLKTFMLYLPTKLPFARSHFSDRAYHLFSRASKRGRESFPRECAAILRQLYSVPSIVLWAPFNEGWGQYDACRIARLFKRLDPTRIVDHASGWYDQGGGDVRSVHNYFRTLEVENDKNPPLQKSPEGLTRPFILSEYGGMSFMVEGHSYSSEVFGYERCEDAAAFRKSFRGLMKRNKELEADGLSAAVYTQVSDVEEEVNGILTYDRKVNKLTGEETVV